MKVIIDPITPKTIKLLALGELNFQVLAASRLAYYVDGQMRVMQIPTNFLTDLGSVPRPLRWVVSVASAPAAFVAHDFLYRCGDRISRRESDAVLLAMMHYTGAPRSLVQRRLAWLGVRLGGWVGFRKTPTR